MPRSTPGRVRLRIRVAGRRCSARCSWRRRRAGHRPGVDPAARRHRASCSPHLPLRRACGRGSRRQRGGDRLGAATAPRGARAARRRDAGVAGASYQGVFRNPLADPYLLGAAAGAGLGATIVIVGPSARRPEVASIVPLAAFVGALGAVALRTRSARRAAGGLPAPLLLAGRGGGELPHRGADLRAAAQLRHAPRGLLVDPRAALTVARWGEVAAAPALRRRGGRRALAAPARARRARGRRRGSRRRSASRARRTRFIIVVGGLARDGGGGSVSGLIGFVGIIVPHTVRLLVGTSYRVILPLSLLFGGAFLVPGRPRGPHAHGAGRDPDRRGDGVRRCAVLRARAAAVDEDGQA